ncbi:hypothetical protein VC83_01460 [Pseudogymnoascus destructans]|uniref:Uncharacterized protein n=2 Tax=Pseudogymnoascus destructans TaxID=655981 RepID=L8FQP5_PSED2|nr:uncharacterized protein VC83_01460 [Pseudogymnoascus destructans]ELR02016.1 hypothetical protein GMDG_05180 [Pseudogymnoascus destructans 20631-21]OAF61863.1 hypothetical protein VC83_01460 [Pseudogymnoascus destructans]
MATKQVLATHAIAALKEQTRKFEAMSVQLAKSADLATNQAAEIAKLTLRLINAMTKIQRDTQRDATARRECLRDKLRSLAAQAVSTKRKILDAAELESSRTIKANFRLIFGPSRETEYKSRSAKSAIATNLIRITTIRGLCESNPHSVIALSTTYSTKAWTESSSDVFDGVIELVKVEKEQDWPEEIVDIIDELKAERPMSAEIELLRATILQQKDPRRRRISDSDGPAREIAPLPPMQTGEMASQTGQHSARMTQLPGLQQMALIAPSYNRDQTHSWNYRQDTTTDGGYNGPFVDEQRQRPLLCESAHHPSQQYEQENPVVDDPLPPSKENREMKDMYTNALASNISKMPEPFKTAIENSRQWKWERSKGLQTTGCWPSLFPKDQTQDVSFSIWCGNEDGEHLTKFFGGKIEMSS